MPFQQFLESDVSTLVTKDPVADNSNAKALEMSTQLFNSGLDLRDSYLLDKFRGTVSRETNAEEPVALPSIEEDFKAVVNRVKSMSKGDYTREEAANLDALGKQLASIKKARRAMSPGNKQSRLRAAGKAFISSHPHLSTEAKSILNDAMYGTGGASSPTMVSPEEKARQAAEAADYKALYAIAAPKGWDLDNPVEYAYARGEQLRQVTLKNDLDASTYNKSLMEGDQIEFYNKASTLIDIEARSILASVNTPADIQPAKDKLDSLYLLSSTQAGAFIKSKNSNSRYLSREAHSSFMNGVSSKINGLKEQVEKYGENPVKLKEMGARWLLADAITSNPELAQLGAVYGKDTVIDLANTLTSLMGDPEKKSSFLSRIKIINPALSSVLEGLGPEKLVNTLLGGMGNLASKDSMDIFKAIRSTDVNIYNQMTERLINGSTDSSTKEVLKDKGETPAKVDPATKLKVEDQAKLAKFRVEVAELQGEDVVKKFTAFFNKNPSLLGSEVIQKDMAGMLSEELEMSIAKIISKTRTNMGSDGKPIPISSVVTYVKDGGEWKATYPRYESDQLADATIASMRTNKLLAGRDTGMLNPKALEVVSMGSSWVANAIGGDQRPEGSMFGTGASEDIANIYNYLEANPTLKSMFNLPEDPNALVGGTSEATSQETASEPIVEEEIDKTYASIDNVERTLGWDSGWLRDVIAFETKNTFSPSIRPLDKEGNRVSSAVGLIQFLEDTAKDLGTTTEELSKMTVDEQLVYVEDYLTKNGYADKVKSAGDAYMAIIYPEAIEEDDDFVVFKKGDGNWEKNKVFHPMGDEVTKGEIIDTFTKKVAKFNKKKGVDYRFKY